MLSYLNPIVSHINKGKSIHTEIFSMLVDFSPALKRIRFEASPLLESSSYDNKRNVSLSRKQYVTHFSVMYI